MKIDNFAPAGTIAISVSTSSSAGTFITQDSIYAHDVMLTNAGSVICYVAIQKASAVAVVPSTEQLNALPVLPGYAIIVPKGTGNASIAAITASGSTTLLATAGEGN